ncbi:MAG: hypothetical protein WC341_17135 [Bacteroidales bacterium]|jgi:hypothetical protein
MARPTQIRPTCNLKVNVSASALLSEIELLLSENRGVEGRIVENHVYLKLPEKELQYWSPEFRVTITEEENGTSVRGLAGPNGKVWVTFMVFYGLAIMLLIFGGSLGISEWLLGMESVWLWSIPASVVLYFFIIVAAKYGQRLGSDQLSRLRNFLDEAIEQSTNKIKTVS